MGGTRPSLLPGGFEILVWPCHHVSMTKPSVWSTAPALPAGLDGRLGLPLEKEGAVVGASTGAAEGSSLPKNEQFSPQERGCVPQVHRAEPDSAAILEPASY